MAGGELDVVSALIDAWVAARAAFDADFARHFSQSSPGQRRPVAGCRLAELCILETGARAAYFAVAT